MTTSSRLTRRAMCRWLVAAPVAAWTARCPAAHAKPEPFSLRYILASSLYGKTKLAEILPEVAKTGAKQIDLWPLPHADQREQVEAMGHERFGELLRRFDVGLGMCTCYDLGPLKLGDEMDFVHRFGGKLLISGSHGPHNVSGRECKAAVKRFVEEMKPHAAKAESLGVVIGIENHASALIYTPESIRYFAEMTTSPSLGIALAPYHLPQQPEVIARLIEDLGPKLVHFYAWQYGRGCMTKLPKAQELEQLPGRGPLDFKPIVNALAKIRYQGWTEIFMHPVPRGIPILPTTAAVTAAVNRARRYLDELTEQRAART